MPLLGICLQNTSFPKEEFIHVCWLSCSHILCLISPLAVGIIGATVMPHSLFLGSTLATQDRIRFREMHSDKTVAGSSKPAGRPSWIIQFLSDRKEDILSAFRKPPPNLYTSAATRHSEHTNNPYEFVRAHIYHGTVDMIGSLLGFAVVINSLCVQSLDVQLSLVYTSFNRILMLASSVFYYGRPPTDKEPASLFDAYDLIRDLVGLRMFWSISRMRTFSWHPILAAAKIFAVALLCAGQVSRIFTSLTAFSSHIIQSSSIIATVAGQAIAEGFLQWRVSVSLASLPLSRDVLTVYNT